jgi:hypothetical protein
MNEGSNHQEVQTLKLMARAKHTLQQYVFSARNAAARY